MTANQVNGHRAPLAMPVFGDWQPVAPPQTQDEMDRTEAAAVLAKANEIHEQAGKDAETTRNAARAELDRARQEAQRIREAAAAEMDQKKKTAAQLDVWAARVVIAGAVGLTASGEYSLARMVGFTGGVAWLLPLVIDVYVIQAFRRHCDILQAIGLTIAANVIYHLAAVGLFGLTAGGKPQWWLIAVVASIASLILWRMHLMIAPPRERKRGFREASETSHAPVSAPPVAIPATGSVAATETVAAAAAPPAETVPETPPAADRATRAATTETPPRKRHETAKKRRTAKPAATRREQPSRLLPKDEQIKIVAEIVAAHDGETDPPLDAIATALGASKATASRRLSEYKQQSA